MATQFTAPAPQRSQSNERTFKKADMFANSQSIVLKDGTEVEYYAQKGMPIHLDQQRNPVALGILQQIHAKQEAGEDVVDTMKVIFRGHKPEVVAATDVSIDDLL